MGKHKKATVGNHLDLGEFRLPQRGMFAQAGRSVVSWRVRPADQFCFYCCCHTGKDYTYDGKGKVVPLAKVGC
jgi:hypothetical protein